jgi:RimJ/RimL family protein N-acetyltransferase
MIHISPDQMANLKDAFVSDRPGPQVGMHVIQTGNGACFVDRWPDPQAILVNSGGNYSLMGDPAALKPYDLEGKIAGFVEAPEPFLPLLQDAFPDLQVWDRIILALDEMPQYTVPQGYVVRPVGLADIHHLWGLSPDVAWIGKTWGGPPGLASSGHCWGAFAHNRLASVACSFFLGDPYEDIGVATEPEFRGLGLSVACSGALSEEIQSRKRRPSWTTSPENAASIRVAERLGFTVHRHDQLYVINQPVPEPASR